MGTMLYKPLDKVRIKSLDWYNENKDKDGNIVFSSKVPQFSWNVNVRTMFTKDMVKFCGKVVTIESVWTVNYSIVEGTNIYYFTDEMIEGLVEEETNDCEKCGLTRNSTRCLFMDNCPHNKQKNIIEIPEGYVLKDENGNVINATKIVLEKKKKEYPKTYEECCKVLGIDSTINHVVGTHFRYRDRIMSFIKLLVCRDAYWKLYGEEMGLDKPWEPDWNNISDKYCIYFVSGDALSEKCQTRQCPFAFPTPEMQDAFKENFDEDLEFCKELL